MRPVLLFDIETIPDHWMAQITGLDTLPDEVAQDPTAMARLFPPKNEGEAFSFPKPLYHQVVEVSACLINSSAEVVTLRHLSTAVSSEADLLRDFWQLFERNAGISISTFNGRKFDVPVLTQRALYNGVSPTALYRGNYRNRFSGNHIDLADILSDFGASPMLTQHEAAMMLGVPGKVGVEGGDVAALWKQGKRVDIAAYCTCVPRPSRSATPGSAWPLAGAHRTRRPRSRAVSSQCWSSRTTRSTASSLRRCTADAPCHRHRVENLDRSPGDRSSAAGSAARCPHRSRRPLARC